MIYETDNLKIEYSHGNKLDLGEIDIYNDPILYTVTAIQKLTFKKQVVFNDRYNLVLDRTLIAAAKTDFHNQARRVLFPRPVFGEYLPILQVKLPPLQECNGSEIDEARNAILAMMGLLKYKGEMPKSSYVWEIELEMYIKHGRMYENIYPFDLNGIGIISPAALPRISD